MRDRVQHLQVGHLYEKEHTVLNVICIEIGKLYGPFDLAMVPIWRGGSLSFIAAMGLRVRLLPPRPAPSSSNTPKFLARLNRTDRRSPRVTRACGEAAQGHTLSTYTGDALRHLCWVGGRGARTGCGADRCEGEREDRRLERGGWLRRHRRRGNGDNRAAMNVLRGHRYTVSNSLHTCEFLHSHIYPRHNSIMIYAA